MSRAREQSTKVPVASFVHIKCAGGRGAIGAGEQAGYALSTMHTARVCVLPQRSGTCTHLIKPGAGNYTSCGNLVTGGNCTRMIKGGAQVV